MTAMAAAMPPTTVTAAATATTMETAARTGSDATTESRTASNPGTTAAAPAMPAIAATPTEAATHGVTAPIITGTAPTVIVPAIIPAAENVLNLLHVAGRRRRNQRADRHCDDWAGENRPAQCERCGKGKFFHFNLQFPVCASTMGTYPTCSAIVAFPRPWHGRFRIGPLRMPCGCLSYREAAPKYPEVGAFHGINAAHSS